MGVVNIGNIQRNRLVDVHFPDESKEIVVHVDFAVVSAGFVSRLAQKRV
jgi:hypothetical protein